MRPFTVSRWLLLPLIWQLGCSEAATDGQAAEPTEDAAASADIASGDVPEPAPDTEPDAVEPEPDEGPPPSADPLGHVYASNPLDTPETTQVPLVNLTDPSHLIGEFASVRGCVADVETGKTSQQNIGIPVELTTCTPTHRAERGADGSYLHITPPDDPSVGDDQLAEVMMYHHMQRAHGYFKGTFGLTELDHPLDAVVNVQVHLAAAGFCEEWVSIANAAFIPPGAASFLPFPIDVSNDAGHIVFSQTDNRDLAYDADVIYHEYTHAMIGATRLNGVFVDGQGLNNQPGALNEAYADYFAATLMDDSVVGNYALADLQPPEVCGFPLGFGGQNLSRDLATLRTCPDDLTAEVHADGEVFGSALWEIRQALGAEKADQVIMGALVTFSNAIDFNVAAQGTIFRANKDLPADEAALVSQAFAKRGLGNCQRVIDVAQVGARGIPLNFEASNPQIPFGGTPGYLQLTAAVPAGAQAVRVTVKTQNQGFFGAGDHTFKGAFRPGAQHVFFNGQTGEHSGQTTLDFVHTSGGSYDATLTGSCLQQGQITFAILNAGGAFAVSSVSVAAADPGAANFDCAD